MKVGHLASQPLFMPLFLSPRSSGCFYLLLIHLWLTEHVCLFPGCLGDEESEDDDEYGNVHIIELHKAEEPLGIHLTHFTSPDGT